MEKIFTIKFKMLCLLIVCKIVVGAFKFRYFIALRDVELDHAEHALIC